MAGRRGLTFIDIWSDMQQNGELPAERTVDGIHLSGAGYIVWIKGILIVYNSLYLELIA